MEREEKPKHTSDLCSRQLIGDAHLVSTKQLIKVLLIAGLEMDFDQHLLAEFHERAFKATLSGFK